MNIEKTKEISEKLCKTVLEAIVNEKCSPEEIMTALSGACAFYCAQTNNPQDGLNLFVELLSDLEEKQAINNIANLLYEDVANRLRQDRSL